MPQHDTQWRASQSTRAANELSRGMHYVQSCDLVAADGARDHAKPGDGIFYLQPFTQRPFKRRKPYSWNLTAVTLCLLILLIQSTSAVFVSNFHNCLDDSILIAPRDRPKLLQWTPEWVDARLLDSNGIHSINITIYGNVSGQATEGTYPPPSSPQWHNPDIGFGKIVDVSVSNNKRSTLTTEFDVLSYHPYASDASAFCDSTVDTPCPIPPNFNHNDIYDPLTLPKFTVSHRLGSSYAFATIISTSRVVTGDASELPIACVAVNITPALGKTVVGGLRYAPVAVLFLVGCGVVLASVLSPWGTPDVFRWTTNYGRDQDLLRLVTPGFGDCLQYIQFIVLAGSMSLAYPGYFQPVVRQVAWSALMFNESFVSNIGSTRNPVDGIYITNSTYGLTRMSQLIGMGEDQDLWANTIIWTLAIIGALVLVCQIGFASRKIFRRLSNNPAEDLRSKNWPLTGGMLVRIVCNFFLLPIVTLSMFQLVVARHSPAVVVAFAVILLVALLSFAGWILYLVVTTKPRSHLFDDLPTVLLYGPLYNTYSDSAAPFALVPALLTFVRGVAIGAIQATGIAQLVILAICEVIMILMLNAFRPFHLSTSMNAYHTFFSAARLATVLLMVAFVPSLGVSESNKGWIGYAILLIHGIVLVFGFLFNAIQTMVEVGIRLAGAGGDRETGAASRGGLVKVFGVRELSKRQRRQSFRHSQHSEAPFLTDDVDVKSTLGGRSRSLSASSAIMLNARKGSDPQLSRHLDRSVTRTTIGDMPDEYTNLPAAGVTNGQGRRPDLTVKTEPADPYYRPPRPRRPTGELMTPGAKSRESRGSADWTGLMASPESDRRDPSASKESGSPPNIAPAPAYMKAREGSETDLGHPSQDYAVREVDYYYGVRGPALSSQGGTRKLKTGPADPIGPVSSTTGWFKGMFGHKKKESGKGFEVVRSSRAPPPIVTEEGEESSPIDVEPYQDSPVQVQQTQPQTEAYVPGERTRSSLRDDESSLNEISPPQSPVEPIQRLPERPPSLDPVTALGGELDFRPSRWNSRVSQAASNRQLGPAQPGFTPTVPPRSPNRPMSRDQEDYSGPGPALSTIPDADSPTGRSQTSTRRMPFSSVDAEGRYRRPSAGAASDQSAEDDRPTMPGARMVNPRDPHNLMPSFSNLTANERPTSFGFVNQFRASEVYLGDNPHAASSAEFVNATPRISRENRSKERDSYSNIGRAQ